MVYTYKDKFIVNSVESDELEDAELRAIEEMDVLNVTDEPFKGMLVVYSVYMELALSQLEAEGMKDKYDSYSKQFTKYLTLASKGTVSSVSNIPIGRG